MVRSWNYVHYFYSFALRDHIDFYLFYKDPNLYDITDNIYAQEILPATDYL